MPIVRCSLSGSLQTDSRSMDITVNSRKFDDSINRSWTCQLVENSEKKVVLKGEFDSEVVHPELGVIKCGTKSLEFYFPGKWYSLFRFHEPDGSFRNYYLNINLPPVFEENVLDFVDLDVDIVVWPDMSYKILDETEFEENAIRFGYTDEMMLKVKETTDLLVSFIETGSLPV